MDTLTFTAEIVKALAWPVVVGVSVCLFRKPLSELLPLLKHIKYKDFEIDFNRRLKETRKEVSAMRGSQETHFAAALVTNPLVTLAQSSPRAAIIEAWLRVETAVRAAAEQEKLPDWQEHSPSQIVQSLEKSKRIDANQAKIFRNLQELRNSAAQAVDFEPDTEAATEYVNLANRLEQSLGASPPAA